MKMPNNYGERCTCKYCAQDIEFLGRVDGWRDRGGNRACAPYMDKKKCVIVQPKTKHAPFRG